MFSPILILKPHTEQNRTVLFENRAMHLGQALMRSPMLFLMVIQPDDSQVHSHPIFWKRLPATLPLSGALWTRICRTLQPLGCDHDSVDLSPGAYAGFETCSGKRSTRIG